MIPEWLEDIVNGLPEHEGETLIRQFGRLNQSVKAREDALQAVYGIATQAMQPVDGPNDRDVFERIRQQVNAVIPVYPDWHYLPDQDE